MSRADQALRCLNPILFGKYHSTSQVSTLAGRTDHSRRKGQRVREGRGGGRKEGEKTTLALSSSYTTLLSRESCSNTTQYFLVSLTRHARRNHWMQGDLP